VLDGDRPVLVAGASGGPLIISGVVQTILAVVDLGLDLRATVPGPVRETLTRVGHQLVEIPAVSAVAAAGLQSNGSPTAAGDRRKDGGEVVAR
jgi:gamma-glutamyltranspeptidase